MAEFGSPLVDYAGHGIETVIVNGVVTVERAALGDRQYIQVVAVDADDLVTRSAALGENPVAALDLRLRAALDAGKHFIEKKQVSVLSADKKLVMDRTSETRAEVYDTIGKVYRLFTTLSNDSAPAVVATCR